MLLVPFAKADLIDSLDFSEADNTFSFNNANYRYGVIFFTNASYWNLTSISFKLQRVGTSTFYFNIKVVDLGNFTDFDNYIGVTADIYAYSISSGATEYTFDFIDPILTNCNTSLAIYLSYVNGTIDSSHYIRISRDVTPIDNSFELAGTNTAMLYYYVYCTCYELYGNEVEAGSSFSFEGNATVNDVLQNQTFYSDSSELQTGNYTADPDLIYTYEDVEEYAIIAGIIMCLVVGVVVVAIYKKKR